MARDRLTDTRIRQAKPGPKPYKLADGGGLFLLVHSNGSKYWRLKYRLDGKEKLFAVGVYPEINLAEARLKTLEARRVIREGSDPVVERRRQRAQAASSVDTFQTIAEEWMASRGERVVADVCSCRAVRSRGQHLPPGWGVPGPLDHGADHA